MTQFSEKEKAEHKAKMQETQKVVSERIKAARETRGILIVITGNGKGKSTSGFGTVTRAVGHGMNAAVAQYVKGSWPCGERNLLEAQGVPFAVMSTGFTWNTQDKETDIAAAEKVWAQCKVWLQDPEIDVVLLDELTYMVSYEYLNLDEVKQAIANRPEHQTVIVTGRDAHADLIEMADTVSEVNSIKHAFENGIKAQKGVDW